MFQKDMKISLLLDFYGDILTERRREIMEMYYNEDLSLSEIAQIAGISRQGVRDSIKKSEAELTELEATLGLAKRFDAIKSELAQIVSDLIKTAEGADEETITGIKSVVDRIEKLDV